MTSQRTNSLTLTLLAVLISTPSSALANPLLSGYGGPGEGNQAILGSALVGGSGGGGGSAGGASGGSPGASPSEAAGPGAQSPQRSPAPTGSKARAGRRAAGQGAGSRGSGSDQASGAGARAYPVSSAENASQATSGETQTLGLSGEDFAYIFLALGALAFTGVLTRRLARTSRPEGL